MSGPGTRVLLIGTGTYTPSSGLPPVPAVPTTLTDLGQALVERCGLDQANLRIVRDPAHSTEMGIAVAEEAERAENVLLVYYVGHGLVSPAGELYLAAMATDRRPGWVAPTGLSYGTVRSCLLQTRASTIVVILDCCFSGRALGTLGDAEGQEVDLARVNGGYVLTSAAREELALAPKGAAHTAFTGELIRMLTQGDPHGPPWWTLRHAYQYLDRALSARNFPRPQRHVSAWSDNLVLAPNPAWRLPEKEESSQVVGGGLGVCPYPGLAAFGAEQARWFFGRERVTSELVGRLAARLEQAVPLVVVGASGSGKSSLLRAGLLPALSAGTPLGPGSRTWPRLLFTPTADPVGALATQIGRLAGEEPAAVRAQLVAEPGGFAATVRRALRARAGGGEISGARVVLVVDQFEETFTQCGDERDRQVFIRALCAAAGTADGTADAEVDGVEIREEPPALVVLGVRGDLYGRCAAYPGLLPALQDGQVVLGPMRVPELRAAIERPASSADLTLQSGLMEALLRDLGAEIHPNGGERAGNGAGYDPGALPLLSHALRVTWEHREDQTLTVAGYQAAGGIQGAVATTAERAFQQFDAVEQRAARQLLLRLVQVGDGPAETRLRADRATLLAQAPESGAAAVVLDALARARLVTVDAETVEITHEALLGAWPRLRGWIDADRAGLHVHQQLTDAAHAWNRDGRPTAALYRDTALVVANEWAEDPDHQGDLGPVEREFLDLSEALRVRQEQRRARRPRQIITSLAVLLVLAVTGSGFILYQNHTRPTWRLVTRLVDHTDDVTSVAFSPDGRTLATSSDDRKVRLWNVTDPARPTLLGQLTGHTDDVTSVAFSPDGRTLATSSDDHTVRLWDRETGQNRAILTGHTDFVRSVAFSPDGHTLATGSNDETVRLWDITTGQGRLTASVILTGHTDYVRSVVFSPDGRILATGSDDRKVRLWNVTDPARTTPLNQLAGHTDYVRSVAFSPDGRTLATSSEDRTVRLWDMTTYRQIGTPLAGHTDFVTSVAFSPDRRTLATTSRDQTVRLWDITTRQARATLTGHTGSVTSVAFSPNSRTLATGDNDNTVRLWGFR